MRIEQGFERSEINIPISEVLGNDGILNIFPNVKKYFSVDYKPQNEKLSFVAGGHIGLVPINSDLAIEIKPKFSISNLTRLVSIAEERFNTLNFINRKYAKAQNQDPVIFEFMAECLANELVALEMEGILKNYHSFDDVTEKLKGRISIANSQKNVWSKGLFNKAAISYFQFTANNSFNRFIKHTIAFCINELLFMRSNNVQLRNQLISIYRCFDSVSSQFEDSDIDHVFSIINQDRIPLIRSYYVNICEICRLIIQNVGVSFNETGNNI